ncbi:MAG: class I SAM-dependent methyltransferase [Cytophagaceae bacterium]
MNTMEKEWFAEWFDSPYYHILYKNRDEKEAETFINKLCSFIQLKPGNSILDLACGKGRHSIFLNKKGFDVTGADLSVQNINHAKKFKNDTLHFMVCDMRALESENKYDVILNLFTSFGYFENEKDNIQTLHNLYRALKPGGILVIDFMNTHKVLENLISGECKNIEGIDFCISRKFQNNCIIKEINFTNDGKSHVYQEKVQALTHDTFKNYFQETGFIPTHVFGNYNLDEFNFSTSDRMIWMAQKK